MCVVLASRGYPLAPEKGAPITGPVKSELEDDLQVFHAGTALTSGGLITSGGRVLGVTALGDTVADARERAYARAGEIHWDGQVYRRDIAQTTRRDPTE